MASIRILNFHSMRPFARGRALRTLIVATLAFTSLACWAEKRHVQLAPWAFHCSTEREHLPAVVADIEQVFQRGLYLLNQRSSSSLREAQMAEFNEVARYLRVAHAHGHPKAGWYLMNWLYVLVDQSYDGVASPLRMNRQEEVDRVIAQMIERHLPDGYRRRGGFAEQGWDLQQALDDYRSAADLGSPEAQHKLAEWLQGESTIAKVVDVARPGTQELSMALYRCAAQQGHAPSISVLARKLLRRKAFAEALPTLQRAVSAGSAEAAYVMKDIFSGEAQGTWPFRALAAKPDPARADRYERIRMFLIGHESDQGVLPDLDQIVPLPPAPLPKWSGQFQWDSERRPAPERPSEALMERLCRERGLHLTTGLPIRPRG